MSIADEIEVEEVIRDRPILIRNSTDLQRLKLEKLMKHVDKPIIIPERPKEKGVPTVPEFVRNVMGSSAGAGSGEFHVYRHLRRKEYARQKYMKEKGERERLNDEYHHKLEENKKLAAERTAKKRAKRLRKKKISKKKRTLVEDDTKSEDDSESSSTDDERETSKSETTSDMKPESEDEQDKIAAAETLLELEDVSNNKKNENDEVLDKITSVETLKSEDTAKNRQEIGKNEEQQDRIEISQIESASDD